MEVPLYKEYTIQGKTLVLKPLTVGQVKQLLSLMEDLDVDENTSFGALLDKVLGEKLEQAMSIIFPNQQAEQIRWYDVEYETLDEVVTDFLHLNPRLIERLKRFFGSLVQVGATATPS